MDNLIVKNFHNKEIHTFFWNNRLCWIAGEVADAMEYADTTATVSKCIVAESFKDGIEFEALRGEPLKAFKQMLSEGTAVKAVPLAGAEAAKNFLVTSIKYASQLTIFYEPGLYGFIEYTEKPIGREFRTWLRRDVLPEIRETGAYISEKADPSLLREKANRLEKLGTVNNTAKILLPVLMNAGVRPEIQALTMQQLYRRAGVELNIEGLPVDKAYYTREAIAEKLGLYSVGKNKEMRPHARAVSGIMEQIQIDDDEKILTEFEKNGHMGPTEQFSESVVEKVGAWLKAHNYPALIPATDKSGKVSNQHVSYKTSVNASTS